MDCAEYVYGIVSTGDTWYFTIFTSNNEFATTQKSMSLYIDNDDCSDEILKNQMRNIFAIIGGLIKEKLDSVNDDPEKRKNRMDRLFKRKRQKTK